MRKSAFLLAALVVAGCARDVDRRPAERAVAQFHGRLDAAQYETIYDSAAASFRNGVRRDTFLALLASVHGTLGAVKTTSESHWTKKKRGDDGVDVTLDYTTSFASGDATERFTWRLEGDRVELTSYDVSSKALAHN